MLQRFKSHKIVEAGKIQRISTMDGGIIAMVEAGGKQYMVPPGFAARAKRPEIGDYFVRYNGGTADEYVSWSPAAVFEEGYDLLLEDEVEDDVDKDGSVDENGQQA
jgi:hypothetical protein